MEKRTMEFRMARRLGAGAGVLALLSACDVPTAPPRFETRFVVAGEEVSVPVTSRQASATSGYDLTEAADLAGRAQGGALVVDVENAAGATGLVAIRITGGGTTVDGTVDLAAGGGQRIPADREQVRALLGQDVTITATGTLCPQSGCDANALPPFPMVRFETRFELMLELGGES
jgi:hypothetical protein